LGTKLEHNDYTGLEVQPNIRGLWKPNERNSLWGAISRAVRSPSRSEDDINITQNVIPPNFPGTPCAGIGVPCRVAFTGNTGFDSENLIAFEAGYRRQVLDNLGADLAAFYNIYDDLRTVVPAAPIVTPTEVVFPIVVGNGLEAKTWGVEVAADWRPLEVWTLRSGYTFMNLDLKFQNGAETDPVSGFASGSSPQNRVFVHSMVNLPYNFEFDTMVRWVDELKSLDIDAYANLDLRLGWKATENLELSIVGQNLLERSNQEFASSLFVADEPTKVDRGVYGKVTLKF
jgi:iron complex outermembrane receptor protein